MEINEQSQGAVIVLKPHGPLVQADADVLRTRFMDALSRSLGRLVIDASAIPYVDSTGLETIADLGDEMAQSGQALKLCNTTETVREVLELTDLASSFDHFDDIQSAVRSFL
jgi:anti-sigma B factor antagonist